MVGCSTHREFRKKVQGGAPYSQVMKSHQLFWNVLFCWGSLFLEVAPSCVQLQSSVHNQTFLLYMQCSHHILLIFLMKMMYGGFLFCVLGSLICCVQYGRSMFRIDLPHVQNFIRLWCICDVFPYKFYIYILDM